MNTNLDPNFGIHSQNPNFNITDKRIKRMQKVYKKYAKSMQKAC